MRSFRYQKAMIAKVAGIAMLMHVLAAAFCPNMASHNAGAGRGYVDAVLGWVTLCVADAQSGSPADNGSGQQGNPGHSSPCASLCAAVVTSIAAFVTFVLAVLVAPILTSLIFAPAAPCVQRRFLFGGIGSRAPPAFV
jgi:hypothetical protein